MPYNLAASGTYIDTDNIIDMGLGLWGGGIQFFTSINPTAVQPVAMPEGFTVFPNPANHAVTINITSPLLKLPATLFVFNALGQQVAEEKMMAGQLVLDLSQLPEGMYFVRLESAQGAFVKKIVVQRPN